MASRHNVTRRPHVVVFSGITRLFVGGNSLMAGCTCGSTCPGGPCPSCLSKKPSLVGLFGPSCIEGHTYIQGVPKKALQFLSIWAQSRCDPDPDHISIGPRLTESVTLFFGHPVHRLVLVSYISVPSIMVRLERYLKAPQDFI